MATKILNANITLSGSQSNIEAGSGFTPKAGLQWVLVEIRPYFSGKGDAFVYVDDQQYIQVASEDVATYGKPHVCAVQIQQPVVLHTKFTDRSGASNFVGIDIVVEESAIPTAGA